MEIAAAMQTQAKALADPSRFRLFEFIAQADGPVGVAELTELLGFNHNAIRQHLSLLVDAGLIDETNEQRTTRGRPRKQYELRADALSAFRSVSGSYEQLAELLLDLSVSGDTPFDVGFRAGRREAAGQVQGQVDSSGERVLRGLVHALGVNGFEPRLKSGDKITLQHCPFADVAAKDPGVVCELHRGLINGHLAEQGGVTAGLKIKKPQRAGCVVEVDLAGLGAS